MSSAVVPLTSGAREIDKTGTILLLNTGLVSALGLVFWIALGQFSSVDVVGQASALLSLSGFVLLVGRFGLDVAYPLLLPRSSLPGRLLDQTATLSLGLSVATALCLVAVLPSAFPTLWVGLSGADGVLLFAAAAIVSSAVMTLSYAMVGLRQPWGFLAVNVTFLGARVLLVPPLQAFGVNGVLAAVVISGVLALALLYFGFLRRALPGYRFRPTIQYADLGLRGFHGPNYLASIVFAVPALILPAVMVEVLGEGLAAGFFMALALATFLYAVPTAFSQAAMTHAQSRPRLSSLLLRVIAICILGTTTLALAPFELLGKVMRALSLVDPLTVGILAAASIPMALNTVYVMLARVEGRGWEVLWIYSASTLVTCVGALILGARYGAPGAAGGVVAGQIAALLWTGPRLLTAVRAQRAHR